MTGLPLSSFTWPSPVGLRTRRHPATVRPETFWSLSSPSKENLKVCELWLYLSTFSRVSDVQPFGSRPVMAGSAAAAFFFAAEAVSSRSAPRAHRRCGSGRPRRQCRRDRRYRRTCPSLRNVSKSRESSGLTGRLLLRVGGGGRASASLSRVEASLGGLVVSTCASAHSVGSLTNWRVARRAGAGRQSIFVLRVPKP